MVHTEERYLLKYSNTKYYKRNSQGGIQGTTSNVEIAGEWSFHELQEKGYLDIIRINKRSVLK